MPSGHNFPSLRTLEYGTENIDEEYIYMHE